MSVYCFSQTYLDTEGMPSHIAHHIRHILLVYVRTDNALLLIDFYGLVQTIYFDLYSSAYKMQFSFIKLAEQ